MCVLTTHYWASKCIAQIAMLTWEHKQKFSGLYIIHNEWQALSTDSLNVYPLSKP